MRVSYLACDRCHDPISSGYTFAGKLVKIQGEVETPLIEEPGDFCSACVLGLMMTGTPMEDTGKYGTPPPAIPPAKREKPLI